MEEASLKYFNEYGGFSKDGKEYLITCLASLSDEGRYKAVQSAINTIIK